MLLRRFDRGAPAPLLRWLRQPLIPAQPWGLRLRFYAIFLLLIGFSSPFLHAYLDIDLSLAEVILHTALVIAAVAATILLVEAVVAAASGYVRQRPISTGGFLLRAAIAYLLSSFAVGAIHTLTPYTRAIMRAHEAAQTNLLWEILPFALLIVYVAYQAMRADYLAREVEALRSINEGLRRAPRPLRTERHDEAPASKAPVLLVQMNGIDTPVRSESILRIQADQNYCHVVVDGAGGGPKRHLVRMTLREALDKMPRSVFIQTHRSHVVNLGHVTAFSRDGRGRELRLSNGDRVPVSRGRVADVRDGLREHILASGQEDVAARAHRARSPSRARYANNSKRRG